MAKRGRKNPAEQLALLERRKNVAQRFIKGEPTWMIARAFEVTVQTIRGDLRAIRRDWREAAVAGLTDHLAKELAEVNEVCRLAWLSFSRSREGTGKRKEVPGNPRWLMIVLDCVKRRCEMLGIDVPRRALIMQQVAEEVNRMSDEEIISVLSYVGP